MITRFDPHTHTEYSNMRLLDSINRPKDLIKRAVDLGLAGLAITDHETLSGSIEINKIQKELLETNPNFKIAIGNEIYLCPHREKGQKYYHFILIAKNAIGHRALRELSSRAWLNMFSDRGMDRVVTTYDDLSELVNKYPNSLIATTACLGGELSTLTLNLIEAEKMGDDNTVTDCHNRIVDFVLICKEMFNDDFYIEVAPGCSKEQIAANKRLLAIAKAFNVPMVIGSDAHYLKKEDRYVHKAYLTSSDGEREVDDFYEYSYLQSNEEIIEHLSKSDYNIEQIEKMFNNSLTIYDKIEFYDLAHSQSIPSVEVKDYPRQAWWGVNNPWADEMENYPTLKSMFTSDRKSVV